MIVEEIERVLRKYFNACHQEKGIAAVYLFGSVAHGTHREGSDVDLGVLSIVDPPPTFDALPLDLEGDLETLLHMRVQLTVLNTAPADLRHRVLRDGRLILDADRSARIRFEVRTRNEYFDLEPILREYRKLAKKGP